VHEWGVYACVSDGFRIHGVGANARSNLSVRCTSHRVLRIRLARTNNQTLVCPPAPVAEEARLQGELVSMWAVSWIVKGLESGQLETCLPCRRRVAKAVAGWRARRNAGFQTDGEVVLVHGKVLEVHRHEKRCCDLLDVVHTIPRRDALRVLVS
jgi:hypothetical protein